VPRISTYALSDVVELRRRIDDEVRSSRHFQESAQRLADLLYLELAESAVLFRVFGTVPFAKLPTRERRFAEASAETRRCLGELGDETPVVCLLGTRGGHAAWDDRGQSKHHLAIPLTSASFIQTIPMVARLMSEMGTGLDWVEKQRTNIVVKSMGRMARMLYVEDAREARTGDGFHVVPDRDFVKAYDVRTVVGLAGAYLDRTIVVILLFTNERIARDRVEKFMPVVNAFKAATMKSVMEGRLF